MTGNNMDNFTDDASPKAGVPTFESGVGVPGILEYVDQLEAHLDEGGGFNADNMRDLIRLVREVAVSFRRRDGDARAFFDAHQHVMRVKNIYREALEDIKASHLPDQPAESHFDERGWVMMWIGRLRGVAKVALESTAQMKVGTTAKAESPGDEVQKGKP